MSRDWLKTTDLRLSGKAGERQVCSDTGLLFARIQ
jgi:hypothetical protein